MIDGRIEAARVVHGLLEHLVGPQQERLRSVSATSGVAPQA
jgi:hypothetical protein